MAFLYAEPIVEKGKGGAIVGCDVPLDLEAEYSNIQEQLS